MKINQLLQYRVALLRQTHVANLAFAYLRLREFAGRVGQAGLTGAVTLHLADPADEDSLPSLTSDEGSQSVIQEHFLDDDIVELADVFSFLTNGRPATEMKFKLEDVADHFLPRLRRDLENAEVEVDDEVISSRPARTWDAGADSEL